ncbi:MAG: SPFH domain-containing protein [Candidatus Saccharimonadales bacterium]
MTKTTINQNYKGLLIREGQIIRVLEPGTYKTYGFRNEIIVTYPAFGQSFGCNISARTKEAATITVETTFEVTITDIEAFHLHSKALYELTMQAATKRILPIVAQMTLDDVLNSNIELDIAAMNAEVAQYGIVIALVLAPTVRLPRNLQNAIDAQEVARQRAKAELEEARGRSAVIRHYANVAKVTKDNPDLLRLLLGQKAKSINVAFDATGKNK